MSITPNRKSKLLILLLLCCSYIYFNNLLKVYLLLHSNVEILSKKDPENIASELPIFKLFSKKNRPFKKFWKINFKKLQNRDTDLELPLEDAN